MLLSQEFDVPLSIGNATPIPTSRTNIVVQITREGAAANMRINQIQAPTSTDVGEIERDAT